MLRSVACAAAALFLAAAPAFADDDPRVAALAAAMPAAPDGYTRSMDDMIEVVEEDGLVSVTRIFASPAATGPVIMLVKLAPPEEIEEEAARMLDPEGMEVLKGRLVEVNGHPGFFWPGALGVFPGRPDSGVSVSLAGVRDADEAVRLAGLVDYDALLAIR